MPGPVGSTVSGVVGGKEPLEASCLQSAHSGNMYKASDSPMSEYMHQYLCLFLLIKFRDSATSLLSSEFHEQTRKSRSLWRLEQTRGMFCPLYRGCLLSEVNFIFGLSFVGRSVSILGCLLFGCYVQWNPLIWTPWNAYPGHLFPVPMGYKLTPEFRTSLIRFISNQIGKHRGAPLCTNFLLIIYDTVFLSAGYSVISFGPSARSTVRCMGAQVIPHLSRLIHLCSHPHPSH